MDVSTDRARSWPAKDSDLAAGRRFLSALPPGRTVIAADRDVDGLSAAGHAETPVLAGCAR
jgi:hypothetical protein